MKTLQVRFLSRQIHTLFSSLELPAMVFAGEKTYRRIESMFRHHYIDTAGSRHVSVYKVGDGEWKFSTSLMEDSEIASFLTELKRVLSASGERKEGTRDFTCVVTGPGLLSRMVPFEVPEKIRIDFERSETMRVVCLSSSEDLKAFVFESLLPVLIDQIESQM